jgi:N-terminal acetyltransferase B complex non-catalytic subunit
LNKNSFQIMAYSYRSKSKIAAIKDRVFGSALELDRSLRLVRLLLRIDLEESLLQDCKDFWKQFSRIPSCFKDLRRAVERMNEEERTEFLSYIEEDMTASKPSTEENSESATEDWMRSGICVLKFTYLIRVSLTTGQVSTETLDSLIERASKISHDLPKDPDPIMLIAYCLMKMHDQCTQASELSGQNSRLLLQATMLVRAAVDRDTEKENRPLALLATRLHLSLGLGRVAFQLWRHVKVKEMLVDTLTPYLLSRIAVTQPFDVKHHQGFSADKELKHVIDTVDRMIRVQEGLIFRDIKRFHWDSAFDLISMNDKLTSSLTRHTAVLERRRIARLKGESAGELPDVSYRSKDTEPATTIMLTHTPDTQVISDTIDRTVFPAYEHSDVHQPYSFLMPDFPTVEEITTQAHDRESVSKILYRDGLPAALACPAKHTSKTPAERHIHESFWTPITKLLWSAHHPDAKADAKDFTALVTHLKQLRKDQETLISTLPTGKDFSVEPPMINESMLIAAYSALEVLRALPRLVNEVRERVVQSKTPHPMKALVPKDWVKEVDAECKATFETIGKVARSYIQTLQTRGAAAMKAQVRSGKTGEALTSLITDADVDFYTKEYVESAVEAWKGVASVKMK